MESKEKIQLPENASRPLKPGEKYEPILKPQNAYPEITPYSVIMGVVMAVIFSAAAAYLGLKVGQVFEAAIPIAIIAVGLSSAMKRKNALGENVIIQSIGASSGVIVAGAIFTLPALYILQAKYPEITVNFMQVFLSSLLGGCLGILFLIPFRKYFVQEKHGEYPFPEATATTQVLVSGEGGGNQAKPLIWAAGIGGLWFENRLVVLSWAERTRGILGKLDFFFVFHTLKFLKIWCAKVLQILDICKKNAESFCQSLRIFKKMRTFAAILKLRILC